MSLSPKQQAAVPLLQQGRSYGEVAKAVGVRPETVGRWQKIPAFQAALSATSATATGEEIAALQWEALFTLESLLNSFDQHVRLKAASEVFRLFGSRLSPDRKPERRDDDEEPNLRDLPDLGEMLMKL